MEDDHLAIFQVLLIRSSHPRVLKVKKMTNTQNRWTYVWCTMHHLMSMHFYLSWCSCMANQGGQNTGLQNASVLFLITSIVLDDYYFISLDFSLVELHSRFFMIHIHVCVVFKIYCTQFYNVKGRARQLVIANFVWNSQLLLTGRLFSWPCHLCKKRPLYI